MGLFSPGFLGRRREPVPGLPPGQHLVTDFPVLSIGPTPRVSTQEWRFSITSESGLMTTWTWDEFQALPQEDVTVDIHCVTSWSKFGTGWRGVSLDTLLDGVDTRAGFAMARSYGGYTTNVPLDELRGGKAWVALQFDGAPLAPEHGGPARLLVPALYFWKSAKWVRSIELSTRNDPGFWEQNGYHMHGDPWREERYW
ncbi:sulfite oxidase-like oxidoreductase [Cryobacterium sp. GrIS_2_6]|uniref:sulfite oxidase-like oxidoreductase n=1 Tax=Cryobacterium sp. GrIS_2_6 TaxID=3162785 RepID=UPI002DF74109|nr:DMSO/TMAO reductase YedYZ molybdopterin-dependent catalytic subunit [Cryobacterium psychrotolerans]